MNELDQSTVDCKLDISFKEFTAGQVIQSKQFNDDMKDVEDKVNEVIKKYNIVVNSYKNHIVNYLNPHNVTAPQVGAYTIAEVDNYIDDLKNGNFNDGAIVNRVLHDDCIEARNVKNGSVTVAKVEENFGSQLDISSNVDITSRYTKIETDEIIKSRVGNGTYTKEEIDEKLGQIQAGQIVDYTIGIEQLKTNVGKLIDITSNPNIINRYTKTEVDRLIAKNGLPRDWGRITDPVDSDEITRTPYGFLPVTGLMTVGEFTATLNDVLDIKIKEVIDSRNGYDSLSARLNSIESVLNEMINMFNGVIINEQ